MRKFLTRLLELTLVLALVSGTHAQDNSRDLHSGQPVSAVIDSQHLTQMYSFASKLPFASGLHLENTGALPLKIVITDTAGNPLITVDDIAPATTGRLARWLPPTDGIYYVVIYPTEALNDRSGSFTLTLDDVPFTNAVPTLIVTAEATPEATDLITAEATELITAESTEIATEPVTIEPTQLPTLEPTQTPSPIPTLEPTQTPSPTSTLEPTQTPSPTQTLEPTQTPSPTPTLEPTQTPSPTPTAIPPTPTLDVVIPATGLQFQLDWQIGARLSLEIRDPQGQTVHWNNPASPDGGVFAGATDPIDCATFSPHPLTQTVFWSAPVQGSYEILVHTIDGCTTAAPFTLTMSLNGRRFPTLGGIAQQNETFVSSLIVNADGTGGLSSKSGMVSVNPSLAIQTSDLVANAEPLPAEGLLAGQINSDQPYHSYHFEGQLGEVVTATVIHTSGNLDTVIALLDTNGNLLAINDDSADDTTDSAINRVRLRHNGTYLIVVTRYAQLVGATQGGFELTVTGVK